MDAYFIIQWQTKECYIGQRWTKDSCEAVKIVDEHREQKHQSLQCFMIADTGEIKEVII